jgi:hypothetical protein
MKSKAAVTAQQRAAVAVLSYATLQLFLWRSAAGGIHLQHSKQHASRMQAKDASGNMITLQHLQTQTLQQVNDKNRAGDALCSSRNTFLQASAPPHPFSD